MGQPDTTVRFQVCVYGRLRPGAPLGTVDATQGFADRLSAERFALAISHRIPEGHDANGPLAWVLVYAMPDPTQRAVLAGELGFSYLCYDHAGVTVKRHEIAAGFYGHCPDNGLCVFAANPRTVGRRTKVDVALYLADGVLLVRGSASTLGGADLRVSPGIVNVLGKVAHSGSRAQIDYNTVYRAIGRAAERLS